MSFPFQNLLGKVEKLFNRDRAEVRKFVLSVVVAIRAGAITIQIFKHIYGSRYFD